MSLESELVELLILIKNDVLLRLHHTGAFRFYTRRSEKQNKKQTNLTTRKNEQ